MIRAVFLDRDGVLNKAILKHNRPYPPASLKEVVIPDDAYHALLLLKEAGFLLICVTNQPDVARGKTPLHVVQEINENLKSLLPLDDIKVCYHDDQDRCHCRKPLPGLLTDASKECNIDLASSFMIGDRWRDIDCGNQAGCKTVLLENNYDEKKSITKPHYIARSLALAVNWILANN